MFNRKLKKRIRSLEEYFGLAYKQPESRDDYSSHSTEKWGVADDIDKLVEKDREEERIKKLKKINK